MNELLLPVLLALPFVAVVVIVVVSAARRRASARRFGPSEPVHRAQADSAAVQDAAVHPAERTRTSTSGRERRAGTARRE